jgi:arylsulfatase A-like enzyme
MAAAESLAPRLDALAREGTRLTNFNVEPSCAPSRSAFIFVVDNLNTHWANH